MKQILLFFFALMLTLPFALSGQIILQSTDYFPAVGDTLRTITDIDPAGVELTAAGGDQVWTFLSVENDFATERIVQDPSEGMASASYPTANVLLEQVQGGEGYYASTATSFALMGYAGTDPLGQGFEVNAPFLPEYVERWAPLMFFDIRDHESALTIAIAADDIPGDIFEGLPVAPDSIRVRVNSDRTDVVDGWGSLEIPGGTYEVLREKRTEYRDVRLDAKIGVLPWFDITDIALENLPIDQLGTDTLVTYSFWSADAKEAIAVVSTDPSETEVERITYKDNGVVSSTDVVLADHPELSIYPNPAIAQTRLRFNDYPTGDYTLEVYSLVGRVVLRNEYAISGQQEELLDITRLKKGMYLCVISDDSGQRMEVKRLVVTTP